MDNHNTFIRKLQELGEDGVLILVLMDNHNTSNIRSTVRSLKVLILVLMDNHNTIDYVPYW